MTGFVESKSIRFLAVLRTVGARFASPLSIWRCKFVDSCIRDLILVVMQWSCDSFLATIRFGNLSWYFNNDTSRKKEVVTVH